MALKRIDWLITLVALLLAMASAYFLWIKPQPYSLIADQQQSIAQITQLFSLTKIRPTQSLAWGDAEKGQQLSEGDEIYTDQESTATIKFDSGPSIRLDPETLIRLSDNKNGILELEDGTIHPILPAGSVDLSININGEQLKLQPSKNSQTRLAIKRNKKSTSIIALSGSGKIKLGNRKEIDIKSQEKISIDHEAIKASETVTQINRSITLAEAISPSLESTSTIALGQPLLFSWRWNDHSNEMDKFTLLIARDQHFNQLINSQTITKEVSSIQIPGWQYSGPIYWAIKKISQDEQADVVFNADIKVISNPVILLPAGTIYTTGKSAMVPLSFLSDLPHPYHLIITNKKEEIVIDRMIDSKIFDFEASDAELNYTVKIAHQLNNTWHWSESEEFKITIEQIPEAPILKTPGPNEIRSIYGNNAKVKLIWASQCQDCNFYELQWGKSNATKTTENVSPPIHSITINESGQYEWLMRQGKQNGEQVKWSPWSTTSTFTIKLMNKPSTPEAGAIVELDRPGEMVHFAWEEDQERDHYEVQISQSDSFSTIIHHKTSNTEETTIAIDKAGQFFWRVIVHRPDGTSNFGIINHIIIRPAPPPSAPVLEEKITIPIKWEEEHSSNLLKTIFNFFVPEAMAEWKSYINLQWPQVQRAQAYRLNICQDSNCNVIIINEQIDKNTFRWNNIKPGIYYWKIAVIDHWQQQSAFSTISQIEILAGEQTPLQQAPQYLSPDHGTKIFVDETVEVEWSTDPNAKDYLLEISEDVDFSKVTVSQRLQQSKYQWKPNQAGTFYWRITSKGKLGDEKAGNKRRLHVTQQKAIVALPPKLAETNIQMNQQETTIKKVAFHPQSMANNWRIPLTVGPMLSKASYEGDSSSHQVEISGAQWAGLWGHFLRPWWSIKFHFAKFTVLQNQTFSDGNLTALSHYPWNIGHWGRPFMGIGARYLPTYDNSTESRRRPIIAAEQSLYINVPLGWEYQIPYWPNQFINLEYRLGQVQGPKIVWKNLVTWHFLREVSFEWEQNSWQSNANDISYSTLSLKIGLSWPDTKQ